MKPDILDRAIREIRDESIDLAATQSAARRVWDEVARAGAAAAGPEPEKLSGCADFRALMPAHLAGTLSPERRLLLEDHLRECVGCRKALATARGTAVATRPFAEPPAHAWRRLALAAGLAVMVIGGGLLTWRLTAGPSFSGPLATVESIDGELMRVAGDGVVSLAAGEQVAPGVPLRTAKASRAVLRLGDGSRVELAARSQLAVGQRRDGLALDLARGRVIVEAATQRRGHLYVSTSDCQVSVVGTIFAVNHGTVGSRVSVLEGEVRVKHGAGLAVLRPGEQVATDHRLARVAIEKDFDWSRDAAAYQARLAALAAIGREIEQAVARPELRTSTRLLDLAPAGTAVWVALPNLSGAMGEAWQMLQQKVAENPTLAQWWQESVAGQEKERTLSAMLEKIQLFGAELGPEVGIAAQPVAGQEETVVILAEAPRPERFGALLDDEIARQPVDPEHPTALRHVADLGQLPAEGEKCVVYVWQSGDLVVASPTPAALRAVAATLTGTANPFVATPFRARLAEVYRGGAGWLIGLDAQSLIAAEVPADPAAAARHQAELAESGMADLDVVIAESREAASGTENRALVAFRQQRRGLASWLASPAPMGSLDFVSPEAHLALAVVFKDPQALLEDVLRMADAGGDPDSARQHLADFEREHGISVSDDLAAAVGGELAFALDGALAPTPAWKLALEIYDGERLQQTIATLVEQWNRETTTTERPQLVLSQEASGDRVFYRLAETTGKWGVEYTFVDGYLLLAPQRATLTQAIAQRAAGLTLVSSSRFQALLPSEAQTDFSALAYQNLASALGSVADLFPAGGEGKPSPLAGLSFLAALASGKGPSLAWADGESDRIVAGTTGTSGPLAWIIDTWVAVLARDVETPEESGTKIQVPSAAPAPSATHAGAAGRAASAT